MLKLRWLRCKRLRASLLLSGVLSASLLIQSELAAARGGYVPRNPTRPYVPTGSTGTRGECPEAAIPTLLVPESYIGKTVSRRPMLAWYTTGPEVRNFELALYKDKKSETEEFQLVMRQRVSGQSGLMTFTLPQNLSELAVGEQYRWQLLTICNEADRSGDIEMESVFQVVPSENSQGSSAVNRSLEQAEFFAQAGIWYDALVVALSNRPNPYWLQLLNDLAQSESAQSPEVSSQKADRLQQVRSHAQPR